MTWQIPLLTGIISMIFSSILFVKYQRDKKIYHFIWGIAILLFSLTSFIQSYGLLNGWSKFSFLLYYVLAGYQVTILATGLIYLINRKKIGDWFFICCTVIAIIMFFIGIITYISEQNFESGNIPSGSDVHPSIRYMFSFLSITGTILLSGITGYSWLKTKKSYLLYILIGIVIFAMSGAIASRLNVKEALDIGHLLGISLLFIGFMMSVEYNIEFTPTRNPEHTG